MWAEGIVFRYYLTEPSEEVKTESLKGKWHWDLVVWSSLPMYKNVIETKEYNVKIPIINVSSNAAFCDVAKALKNQEGK